MPKPAGPEEPDQPNPAEIPVCSVFPQGLGELAQARTTCSTNGSAPPTVSILMSPLLHTTGFRPGDDWLSSHRGISDYSTCLDSRSIPVLALGGPRTIVCRQFHRSSSWVTVGRMAGVGLYRSEACQVTILGNGMLRPHIRVRRRLVSECFWGSRPRSRQASYNDRPGRDVPGERGSASRQVGKIPKLWGTL